MLQDVDEKLPDLGRNVTYATSGLKYQSETRKGDNRGFYER